jgi:hypothetical protein
MCSFLAGKVKNKPELSVSAQELKDDFNFAQFVFFGLEISGEDLTKIRWMKMGPATRQTRVPTLTFTC